MTLRLWLGLALLIPLRAGAADTAALAEAMDRGDLTAVRAAVAVQRQALGDKAGLPEVEDTYQPVPDGATWLTPAEARRGWARTWPQVRRMTWWKVGLDPTALTHPLREPAAVVGGSLAAMRSKLEVMDESQAAARAAVEFLQWAQEQAGTGGFPFPAVRGNTSTKPLASAGRFLERAEKAGRLGEVTRNGWMVDDLRDGGLQFDNGECGVALLEYYEQTRDTNALAAARRAADWALARPLVPNWNYNSFSVWLLARMFTVTGEARYLEAARKKALLGVIPGQLTDGPRAGRWVDPHNARPAYHYIMLRALAQLAAALPADDPARAEVRAALARGLTARNREFVTQGVMTREKAMEVLLLVHRLFAGEPDFLRETASTAALDALARQASAEARHGKAPLGPREWGLFLEYVVTRE